MDLLRLTWWTAAWLVSRGGPFSDRRGKNISLTILFEVILVGACMIDGITLFLVWDGQNKIRTIQRRHITKDRIMEGPNGKGDGMTLCDHETRFVLMNPPQLIRRRMRGGGHV